MKRAAELSSDSPVVAPIEPEPELEDTVEARPVVMAAAVVTAPEVTAPEVTCPVVEKTPLQV